MSTIDYIVRNIQGEEGIEEIKIVEKEKSDHMPIDVRMREEEVKVDDNEEKKLIINWNEEGVEEYRRWLRPMAEGKKWWNLECKEKRKKVQDALRKSRTGEGKREDYLKERKEYRLIIEKPKRKEGERIAGDMERDKSRRVFWKEVGKRRKKRQQIDESIEDGQCIEHFRRQLGETTD